MKTAPTKRALKETLYLLSIPGMRESILEGMQTPLAECVEAPGWRDGRTAPA